jgi:acyl dehydratase
MGHVGSDSRTQESLSSPLPAEKPMGADDEIYEGQVLNSPLVVIDQQLINAYAELCGDRNPIHLDQSYAQACGLKTTLAHGALVLSRALGLAYDLGCFRKNGTQFKEASLKFKEPIYAGDRIGLRLTITKVKELKHDLVRIVAEAKIINDEGVEVHEYEWHGFFNKRFRKVA